MATVEDELAALKDMLDADVINTEEYQRMSEDARKRHGVREPKTGSAWRSQSAQAQAKQAREEQARERRSRATQGQTQGRQARAENPAAHTPIHDMTFDQMVESVGAGVAGVVTGQGAKSKVVAALLAIFLGVLGAHKFYLGYTKEGLIMLAISILGAPFLGLGPLVCGFISVAEFFIYLTRSPEEFERTYVQGRKGWF